MFRAPLLVLTAGVLALAGCAADTEPAVVTPIGSTAAPAGSGQPQADGCSTPKAAERVETGVRGLGGVTEVAVVGQCTRVVVTTTRTGAGAAALCDDALTLITGLGIGSVSVEDAAGTELAMGVEGARCLQV